MKRRVNLIVFGVFMSAWLQVAADTNLVVTDFLDGYITWTNVDSSLYYSIQWKPSLTGSNEWSESFRILQDVQSSNDLISVPIPMFMRVVGRTNPVHTLVLNPNASVFPAGYYDEIMLSSVDSDLSASNILKGTTLFGVEGSLVPGGGSATPDDVVSGKTFYGAGQSNWILQVGTYGEFTCDPGYYDLNGRAEDGCEFWLDPDGIYVSVLSGVDDATAGLGPDGTGSGYHPCRTISHGLDRAVETGRTTIYVACGFYHESIMLESGISLRGGYDPVDWSRNPQTGPASTITGNNLGLHKKTISGEDLSQALTVEGFTLKGIDAEDPGGNSYVVWLNNLSATVTFSNNLFFAGGGANGAKGADGSDGAAGLAGSPGLDSVSPAGARSGGSGGILTDGIVDISGGNGGGNATPPSYDSLASALDGANGQGPSGGGGGAGGYDGLNEIGTCYIPTSGPFDGTPGMSGADGSAGAYGAGASSWNGYIIFGDWLADTGSPGQSGQPGSGGGGGGAGGGAEDGGGDSVAGPTGGGGGSGGGAGEGGAGGAGGGGSFCIFLHNFVSAPTAPVIVDNIFNLSSGGSGGAGGNAGLGGGGGLGGAAGTATILCSGNAGDGGAGGTGGPGGGGGGGAGGMSCGILLSGVTGIFEGDYYSNDFYGGTAGDGGPGGYSIMNSGQDGVAGTVLNVYIP